MPEDNARLLRELLSRNEIRLSASALLDGPPPRSGVVGFGRVESMMLGLAVGDALGATSEGLTPQERRAVYGEVRSYLPNRRADGAPYGLPTDDSQMAFWTLELLVEDGALNPERLMERFASRRIYGIGGSVHEALSSYRRGLRPWYRCAPESAGNGALMRIAPVLIPHLRRPSPDLWADVVLAALTTHNDRASFSACLAWVSILWQLLGMDSPPEPAWWLEEYVRLARPLEGDAHYRARGGAFAGYVGPVWRFVAERLGWAHERGLSARDACDAWFSGAYLLETVPSVLYILMRHADDPEEAIIRAVNDTMDNDTIAAIVGSAVGALHGRDALPRRWLDGLSGRTQERDSGRMFELLAEARAAFWSPTNKGGGAYSMAVPTPGPIAESYWVEPGRLLAGEYPGPSCDDEAREKLRTLVRAGVDLFIDLTQPDERGLRPYARLLAEEASALGRAVERFRMGIDDLTVPSIARMRAILDAIDDAVRAGRTVYIHCLGGVGRTGTVVGCYLVRRGLTGEQALARVAALFANMPKSRRPGRSSPETEEQARFVREWSHHERPDS